MALPPRPTADSARKIKFIGGPTDGDYMIIPSDMFHVTVSSVLNPAHSYTEYRNIEPTAAINVSQTTYTVTDNIQYLPQPCFLAYPTGQLIPRQAKFEQTVMCVTDGQEAKEYLEVIGTLLNNIKRKMFTDGYKAVLGSIVVSTEIDEDLESMQMLSHKVEILGESIL